MIDVLVVGAGPTGLALALELQAHGVDVRVVERRVGPQASRAFVVQPRTLEVLSRIGVADALVERGDPSARGVVHAGRRTARVGLARTGRVDTAFPFLLAIPQATVEEVLETHLGKRGLAVEHGLELVGLEPRPDSVHCLLRDRDGQEERRSARYVVGCDVVDSTVRGQVGIAFPGRPYRPSLLLADLEVDGGLEPSVFHGFVGRPGILFLLPSTGESTWRLLTVRPGRGESAVDPDLGTLQAIADRFTGGALRLRDPTWTTEIRLRRAQATRYRAGRVLLAGDAAHVHSPAGAQGMNTGIQDACNLGQKLARVVPGAADDRLLDAYEIERWPVARRTRQLTDLAFLVEAFEVPPLGWLREHVTPLLLPLVDGRSMPRWLFRLVGGLWQR